MLPGRILILWFQFRRLNLRISRDQPFMVFADFPQWHFQCKSFFERSLLVRDRISVFQNQLGNFVWHGFPIRATFKAITSLS